MASRSSTIALSFLLVAALVVAAVYWLGTETGKEQAPPENHPSVPSQSQPDPEPPIVPERLEPPSSDLKAPHETRPAPTPTRTPHQVQGMMQFPDGSFLPALNGVERPPALIWSKEFPYSPVVRIVRDSVGKDWWQHADGTYSTTFMTETVRMGQKQMEATSQVAHPAPVTPMEPQGGVEPPPVK